MDNNYNTGRGGWLPPPREKAVETVKKAEVEAANPYDAVKNALGIETIQINRVVPEHPPQRLDKPKLMSLKYLNDNNSTAFFKKSAHLLDSDAA